MWAIRWFVCSVTILLCLPLSSLARPLSVVATTGMIGDVASNIGGPLVAVTTLMGEGVDPHLYKPAPGDMRLLAQADIVLYNGLHLEGRMVDALENLSRRKPVYAVTDSLERSRLRSPPEFQGSYDPHVWFDVALWSEVAHAIEEILTKHLPPPHDALRAQAKRYLDELRALDRWVRETVQQIPPSSRVLVTAHDAFGYFGHAYGIEVMGIQGMSTDSEASIRDISSLIDTITTRRVKAVFIESSVPRKTIDSLVEGAAARGHTVRVGGELFSDSFGPAHTPEGTYIGMIRHNVSTILEALR